MRKGKSFTWALVILLLFFVAAVLIGYPFLSDYLFVHRTASVVNTVRAAANEKDKEEKALMRQKAQTYNEMLFCGYIQQKASFFEMAQTMEPDFYQSLLNVSGDGVMGVVEIPCIDVRLPIYHGTDAESLEKGAGHLQGTSLPVGGDGTHTVLTGHTGLSNARLFTDLTAVKEGDTFSLEVLGERLTYQVDQIRTVLPSDVEVLHIEKGKDYCTLLTCTPYGMNTHRLLVRGVRQEYSEEKEQWKNEKKRAEPSQWMKEYKRALCISLTMFGASLLTVIFVRQDRREKKRKLRRKRRKKGVYRIER